MRTLRRKQHRPRRIDPAGGLSVFLRMQDRAENARPIGNDARTDLQLAYWISFHAMTQGASSEEHWSVVAVSLNVALILTEHGFGREYEPYVIKALDAAFRAHQRGQRTGAWRYDGEGINAVRDALELHDEQLALATKDQVRAALAEVNRRVDAGDVYQAVPLSAPATTTPEGIAL
ncbi:MAG: hypothetical protein WBG17_05260 [Burkholderiaceae bacterium]